jgi:CHAT domain-containing protein/tetratricopeptide (TPR) repeat protein
MSPRVVLVSALAWAALGAFGQTPSRPPPRVVEQGALETGARRDHEIGFGEIHRFRLRLEAGEFVELVVDQRRIGGIELSISDANGKRLAYTGVFEWGEDVLCWIAESRGEFLVEASTADTDPDVPPGRYELRVRESRPSRPADRDRIQAQALIVEAAELQVSDEAEPSRRAREKLDAALPLTRSSGDRWGEATAHYYLGRVHSNIQDIPASVASYSAAIEIWSSLGSPAQEGVSRFLRGANANVFGKTDEAMQDVRRALELLREAGFRSSEAEALGFLGMLQGLSGDLRAELETYEVALPLLREIRNRPGEVNTLNNLAYVYEFFGDKQKALDGYRQSMDLAGAIGQRALQVGPMGNLGVVYAALGDRDKAVALWNEALRLAETVGDRRAQARLIQQLGRVDAEDGKFDRALESYEKALGLLRQMGDRRRQCVAFLYIGEARLAAGQPAEARAAFEEALAISREVANPPLESSSLTGRGRARGRLGESQAGLDDLGAALAIQRRTGDLSGEVKTLYEIARLERAGGDLAGARRDIEAAIDRLEAIRSRLASPELRALYVARVRSHYELLVDVLVELHRRNPSAGFAAEALRASERAHARSLLEVLKESAAEVREGIDPALREREADVRRLLAGKLDARLRVLSRKHTPEEADRIEKEVEVLIAEHERIDAEIRVKSPAFADLTRPAAPSVDQLRESALEPGATLVEYFVGGERSYVFELTNERLDVHELPGRKELEDAVRRFYGAATDRNRHVASEGLEARRGRLKRSDKDADAAAGNLARTILGPVAAGLGTRRLRIVPDGALQYVPFAALPQPPHGRLLAADHEIVTLPSASVLAVLRREHTGRVRAPRTVAVLADPVFDGADPRVGGRHGPVRAPDAPDEAPFTRSLRDFAPDETPGGRHIPRLPFTRREAAAIATLVRSGERREALDFEASLASAKHEDLRRYRIVHFATHGFLNSAHPELSGLVFSLVDPQGHPKDGFLSVLDAYNLRLPADLVVLSACRTGLGKEIQGEGLLGLTRGFMYAGAARVLVSLWNVDDAATADLMSRFYRGMLGPRHLSPAGSLREAQISISNEPRWRAPYYWAGFVLQGEPR